MLKNAVPLFLVFFVMSAWFSATAMANEKIIVSAAASLTDAFNRIGKGFEKSNPGTKVIFNFAASGPLMQQIVQGAPVDVFASADIKTMNMARMKGVVDAPTVVNFAGNKLVLVAPKKSAIKSLKDLMGGSVKRIAVGNPETVPVGRYTKEALTKDGMWKELEPKVIYADSVRQTLEYVARGEVDAGFVYATDAAIVSRKVKVVSEVSGHQPVVYPIAVVSSTRNRAAALSFIKYLLSDKGRAVLARYGFSKP
ncbi:MAG: molybdate ABC transporter substrate-binding protein [Nitrospirota bacterium]